MIYPPLDLSYKLPDLELFSDDGQVLNLSSIIQNGNEISLLVPGFTTCHGVCPLLARQYKTLLADPSIADTAQKISVIFFSFDPEESLESLRHFRDFTDIPDTWILAHASPEATQELLSSLQYTVMKSDVGFQHPAQAYVFTKDLKWVASLYGTDIESSELVKMAHQVRFEKEYPKLSTFFQAATNPNAMAITAGGGFLFSVVILSWLALKFSRRQKKVNTGHSL